MILDDDPGHTGSVKLAILDDDFEPIIIDNEPLAPAIIIDDEPAMSDETETAASLKDQGRVKSRKPDKSKARVIRFRQRKKQEKMASVVKATPTLASLWSRHEPEVQLSDTVVEDCASEDSESFLTEKEGSELEKSEHDPSWSLSGKSESDENDSDNLSEGEDENFPTRHRLDMKTLQPVLSSTAVDSMSSVCWR